MYRCKLAIKAVLAIFFASHLFSGCASSPSDDDKSDEVLYQSARDYMKRGLLEQTAKKLEKIENNYPFSPLAAQVQLDLIYTYYQSSKYPQAIAQAQKFIRTNPTHENVDYAYYMQALSHERIEYSALLNFTGQDSFKRDQSESLKAFNTFKELINLFPESIYVRDAQTRMVAIREKLAAHNLAIAQYYQKRRAWIAVVERCKNIVEEYPQTTSLKGALTLMHTAYIKLNLTEEAKRTQAILNASFPSA